MQDSVHGVVTNIIGKDSFEIQVLETGRFNEHNYKNNARIRVAGSTGPGSIRVEKLKNKQVDCFILAKDSDGNSIAVVQCIN